MLDEIISRLGRSRNVRAFFPMLIRYSTLGVVVRVRSMREIAPGAQFRVLAVNAGAATDDQPEALLPLQSTINAHIRRVLDACRGDLDDSARVLEMSKETVRRWTTVNDYAFRSVGVADRSGSVSPAC